MVNISKLPDDMIYYIKSFVIFKPKTKQELVVAIKLYNKNFTKCKKIYGDISLWNTSLITDMSGLFSYSNFKGDISNWNTINVTDMSYMFNYAENFNQDIGNWNMSNVIYKDNMFPNKLWSCVIQ